MGLTAKENQKAYREAVEAIKKEKVDEVKVLVKQALEELNKAEKARRDAVEKTQLIKRDLDDLRAGHLDKIKERHEKIKKADIISQITPQKLELLGLSRLYTTYNTIESLPGSEFMQGTYQLGTYGTSWSWTSGQLQGATSGTYILDDGSIKHM